MSKKKKSQYSMKKMPNNMSRYVCLHPDSESKTDCSNFQGKARTHCARKGCHYLMMVAEKPGRVVKKKLNPATAG
jgi:hypothetical protein